MPVRIQVKQTGRVQPAKLDHGELTTIGQHMVAAQKDRWSRAINAEGNPAKKLSVKYFFIKRRIRGGNPVRDYHLTGTLLANFQLRRAMEGQIRAEPTSRKARDEASGAESIEQMIGFAGSDQTALFRDALSTYGKKMQKAWVPLK